MRLDGASRRPILFLKGKNAHFLNNLAHLVLWLQAFLALLVSLLSTDLINWEWLRLQSRSFYSAQDLRLVSILSLAKGLARSLGRSLEHSNVYVAQLQVVLVELDLQFAYDSFDCGQQLQNSLCICKHRSIAGWVVLETLSMLRLTLVLFRKELVKRSFQFWNVLELLFDSVLNFNKLVPYR